MNPVNPSDVVSFDIGTICMESYPCQHPDCTLVLKDGRKIEHLCLNGQDIYTIMNGVNFSKFFRDRSSLPFNDHIWEYRTSNWLERLPPDERFDFSRKFGYDRMKNLNPDKSLSNDLIESLFVGMRADIDSNEKIELDLEVFITKLATKDFTAKELETWGKIIVSEPGVDVESMIQGMNDYLAGNEPRINDEEFQKKIEEKINEMVKGDIKAAEDLLTQIFSKTITAAKIQ